MSSVIGGLSRKVGFDNQTLPESTDDHRATQLHHVPGRHRKWLQGDRHYQSESYAASQSRRGLASEAGYDSYFALRPSPDAIPKSVIESIFNNLDDEVELRQALRAYLGKTNKRKKYMIGLLFLDLRFRFANHPKPKASQSLLDALLSVGQDVLSIPWSGEPFVPEPRGTFGYLVRDLLEAWGEADAGRHLLNAFSSSQSVAVLADIYVDRGRELGIFPTEGRNLPVVSNADFEELGALLLPKIVAAVGSNSIEDAPYYWDIVRSWAHLGNETDVKKWLRQGIDESGKFCAKVAMGMVSQSMSDEGIKYEYRTRPKEDLYDEKKIYEAAKQHVATDPSLSSDEQSLLRAVIRGVEKRIQHVSESDGAGPAEKRQTRKRTTQAKVARQRG